MNKEQALLKLEQLISRARKTGKADIYSGLALGFAMALLDLDLITCYEFSVYVDRALSFDLD
ncbi:hypothetical protein EXU29_19045 [Acinetobacter wuhouensis]|uniref:hypothetical protein n=1 Tax=Acinetobacter wuhouensis TaxID=1879050 RepID=UPI0010236E70|nr:hypothetical protein [Acinetobacter wuhouensis]RZG64485.1 hypothetical protein EXU29_19045 [Acinetobacter wuhouensis]